MMGEELTFAARFLYEATEHAKLAKDNNVESMLFFYKMLVGLERYAKIILVLQDKEIKRIHRPYDLFKECEIMGEFNKNEESLLKKINNLYIDFRYFNFGDQTYQENQRYQENFKNIFKEIDGRSFIKSVSKKVYKVIKEISGKQNMFLKEYGHVQPASFLLNEFYSNYEAEGVTMEYVKKEAMISLAKNNITLKNDLDDEYGLLHIIEPLNIDYDEVRRIMIGFVNNEYSEIFDIITHYFNELDEKDKKKRMELINAFGERF